MSAIPPPTRPDAPSRPAKPGHARPLLVKVLLACTVLVVAVSCTGRPSIPKSYGSAGSSVERHFVEGCMAPQGVGGRITNERAVCECAYASVKKQIPFDEFRKINSKLSDHPGPLPDKLQKIITRCSTAAE